MTNFLQWRKMTWALLLWSAAMTAWILIGSISATQVGVLWAAGMASSACSGLTRSRCSNRVAA